jgi:phage major head subunit gpT-like protein
MIINAHNLELAYKGFQTVYNEAKLAAPSHAMEIAMAVPSSARDETYGWLGAFPQLREWVGPRHVKGLKAHGFTTRNRKFESTVSVSRDDIADDRLGIFKPMFSEMGTIAARHLRRTGLPVRRGRAGVRPAEIGLRLAVLRRAELLRHRPSA